MERVNHSIARKTFAPGFKTAFPDHSIFLPPLNGLLVGFAMGLFFLSKWVDRNDNTCSDVSDSPNRIGPEF
jgi:hypothetical protein